MLLKEKMMQLPDNLDIYIGSRSGYMVIGNKKYIESVHLAISDFYLNRQKKSLAYRKNILDVRPAFIASLERTLDNEKLTQKKRESIKRKIEIGKQRIAWSKKTIPICEQNIKDFKDIYDREIKDIYWLINKKGIAIVIEGIEEGISWDKEEYNRWLDEGGLNC